MGYLSPLDLCLSFPLMCEKGEYWRLLTNFAYFEGLSINFFVHMHFIYQYFRRSEQHFYYRNTSEFITMLIFGAVVMLIVAYFRETLFLSMSFLYYVLYIWCRRNPHEYMHVLGVMAIPAPYLPYLFLLVSYALDGPIFDDVLGIAIGHTFWFLSDVCDLGRSPGFLSSVFPANIVRQ